MKNEGMIVYDTTAHKEKLSSKEQVIESFKEMGQLIAPFLAKEVWGRRDVIRTLEDRHVYLIQKILSRGGIVTREDLVADLARDATADKMFSFYRARSFEESMRSIDSELSELIKSGYIVRTPLGYRVPDFVMYDFLSDATKASEILSNLSADLWMGFEFQNYLSVARQLGPEYDKIITFVNSAVTQLQRDQLNDALDSLNVVCEELSTLLYRKIISDQSPVPTIHARLVEIWKKQHLWQDDPQLGEAGRNAAVFLSSLMYVAKWMRDKSSHPLIKPTRDAVRMALASVLISIDVCRSLKILE